MQVSETDNMTQHAHVCVRAVVCMCVWWMWIISIQLISVTRAC